MKIHRLLWADVSDFKEKYKTLLQLNNISSSFIACILNYYLLDKHLPHIALFKSFSHLQFGYMRALICLCVCLFFGGRDLSCFIHQIFL